MAPAGAREFSFFPETFRISLGAHRLLFDGYHGSFSWLKQARRETDKHSPSLSNEDKSASNALFSPHAYLHDVQVRSYFYVF